MRIGRDILSDLGSATGQYYIIGRVDSIILSKNDPGYESSQDIGKVSFTPMYSPLQLAEASTRPAYPAWGFMKQFPVIGEIVLIFTGPTPNLNDDSQAQQSFYFPPYNLWNDCEQNAFVDQRQYTEFVNQVAQIPGAATEGTPQVQFPLGNVFRLKEIDNIRNLQPFEGDVILQGRFGQSIRFGSSNIPPQIPNSRNPVEPLNPWSIPKGPDPNLNNGDPITIILNEQGRREAGKFDTLIEDFNLDGSAIYLTSTQTLDFTFTNEFPLKSFGRSSILYVDQNPVIIAGTKTRSANEQDSRNLAS